MDMDIHTLDQILLQQNGRIIHQVWFGTIPNRFSARKTYKKLKRYRESWKIKNPTWFHIEWNKKICFDFMKTFYNEHLSMFSKYKFEIQRCDSIRYFILHRYGGIYADMDYYCCKPFDTVFEEYKKKLYLVETPNSVNEMISNSLMFSSPNHPFWKNVFLELQLNQNSARLYSKHLHVMCSVGPLFLNRVFAKYKYKYNLGSFPKEKFQPYDIHQSKISLDDTDAYAIHVSQGAWHSRDTRIINIIRSEWYIFLFIFFILAIPFFVYRKKKQK